MEKADVPFKLFSIFCQKIWLFQKKVVSLHPKKLMMTLSSKNLQQKTENKRL